MEQNLWGDALIKSRNILKDLKPRCQRLPLIQRCFLRPDVQKQYYQAFYCSASHQFLVLAFRLQLILA